uniref:peptide-N4-(N-acetyl-beta- glucosaminyl)asparagine amidase A-like n=1 Tax=Erigeron canadensis TaxID=72917 RepID=UPI001CB90584|nr:peptide-N4-(N-acetyl-beta-glucosaminyl)asparagine amidase A-like [Erigeron canadensis]
MNNVITLLFFLLPLFFPIPIQSFPNLSLSSQNHFINRITRNTTSNHDTEYFEVTQPLPTDDLTPTCSINVLNHTFENNSNSTSNITSRLVNVPYSPPPATCQWSHVVLDFHAQCQGEKQQHDDIAGLWINGVELLRTSISQPNEYGSVVFWNIRKDVTRYSSVLAQNNLTFSLMIENLLNEEFVDVYFVNVSLLFYNGNVIKGESLYPYETPADLIVPVSGGLDESGFWLKIHNESDVQTRNVEISQKSYKAVLEVYVSFHGDDEFWYMNPPDSYITANNLNRSKGNGAYREVLVTVDGNKLVGTVIPFPVIYTKGINPLLWKPVVSFGAFDLPSYDINFTPFLGLLLDNKNHSIGFEIAGGVSFWLVDANLHLWLDQSNVIAIVEYEPPAMEIEHEYEFEGLKGEFEIEVERKTTAIGWIQSSLGFLKTKITEKNTFKNKLKYLDQGTRVTLEQEIKVKTKVKITTDSGHSIGELEIEKVYPLKLNIVNQPGFGKGCGYLMSTSNVVQGRTDRFTSEKISRVLKRNLNCTSSMVVKDNGLVVSGSMENHQNYDYKDEFGCYSRRVEMVGGDVIADQTSSNCVD